MGRLLTLLRPAVSSSPYTPADFIGAAVGDYWIGNDLTRLFTDSAETTPVATNGDPVGAWRGQLDTFSLTEAVAGNKPLWNAADNAVRLPYYKYLSTLVGGNIYAAGVESCLFIYAKLVDYAYVSAGDPTVVIYDSSGYIPGGLSTGGFSTAGDGGHVRAAKYDGTASFSTSISYDVGAPAKTAFRAAATSRSGADATRGVWGQYLQAMNTDADHFDVYAPRSSANMGLYADGDPGSFKVHVKMILAAQKAMTNDDLADLIAYAESLP